MQGLIEGTTHLCQGQEAVSVGAVGALAGRDYLTITYRGHGHALARGMAMESAFGELMGRTSGCCKGVGGSMHLTDFSRNLIGAFAIIGPSYSVGAGSRPLGAPAGLRRRGDGVLRRRSDEHRHLPRVPQHGFGLEARRSVFVIENNLYGEYSPLRDTTAIDDLADRAKGYGIPGVIVDGQDVDAVREAADMAIARARAGDGPTLIEAKTYRYRGHSRTDPAKYRKEGELERVEAPRSDRSARRASSRPRACSTTRPSRPCGPRSKSRSTRPPRAPPRLPSIRSRRRRRMSTHLEAKPAPKREGVVEMTYREAIKAALEHELADDPDRPAHGRGRCDRRRGLQDQRGPAGEVRARAHLQHADLRERLHRRRARHGGDRAAARGRDHVQRFPAHGGRRDRERAAQVPLHVGRPVRRPGDRALDRRGHRPLRYAALRDGRVLVHRAAGPQGGDRRDARLRLRGAARGDPRGRPGALLRAQGPLRSQGAGRAR